MLIIKSFKFNLIVLIENCASDEKKRKRPFLRRIDKLENNSGVLLFYKKYQRTCLQGRHWRSDRIAFLIKICYILLTHTKIENNI